LRVTGSTSKDEQKVDHTSQVVEAAFARDRDCPKATSRMTMLRSFHRRSHSLGGQAASHQPWGTG
jgi:hypothetical protein